MKNTDGTITGTAIGRFALSTKTASGSITTETIDGSAGSRTDTKPFFWITAATSSSVMATSLSAMMLQPAKITFGAGVSLNWTNAIQQAKTETLNAAATAQNKADAALGSAKSYADTKKSEAVNSAAATAQSKADAALNSAKSYADTKKNEAITQAGKDADSKISALTTTLNASIADAKKAGTDARAVADAITSKANTEGWSNKLTYIDANGIFTGKLSANTVSAININASQITAGTIATARLNAAEIRSNIINAAYINGLTCAFVRGTIGGWTIGATTLSNSHILLDSGNKRVVVYGASSERQAASGCSFTTIPIRISVSMPRMPPALVLPVSARPTRLRVEHRCEPYLQKQHRIGCGRLHHERQQVETQQRRFRQHRVGEYLMECSRCGNLFGGGIAELDQCGQFGIGVRQNVC